MKCASLVCVALILGAAACSSSGGGPVGTASAGGAGGRSRSGGSTGPASASGVGGNPAGGAAAAGSGGNAGGSAGAASGSDAADETAGSADAADVNSGGADAASSPLRAILEQFTAADVPARGPMEGPPIPPYWTVPTSMPMLPGNGLAQHPMLYAGEGYNTVFVINHGKVVWSYSIGTPGEIDDVWMLSNGHVLIAFDHQVLEVNPKKELVWKYDPPATAQVHSCQPVGLDRVLFVQNDLPPKVMLINKKTGVVELNHPLAAPGNANPGGVHTQFRRFRLTAAGTYLASFLEIGKVVEYDKDFNPIWTYPIATPWASVRLHNGNTMITNESARTVREVNPKGETVWEFKQSDLPAGVQQNTQSADRLANGNTVIFSSRSPKDPMRPNIQAVEVTPDKKVVWILQDWKNLGPAATAQFLDEPGIPENPGELQH